jgi:hypothetical protein
MNTGTGFEELADGNAVLNFLVTQGKKLYEKLVGKLSDYVPKLMTIAQMSSRCLPISYGHFYRQNDDF